MRKILAIIVFGLILNFNAIAEEKVFYSSDEPATGFDSGRQEDLEEVRYMNELYEITLGHEDTPNPLEMDEFYTLENWWQMLMRN